MTNYREPPKSTSRRSVGNLDGTSFGFGGVDTARIQAGTGDFLATSNKTVDNSYVSAKSTVVDIKMQNVGVGSGVFARRERDGSTYSFRRLQAGAGMTVSEVGDSIVFSATGGVDRFLNLKDVPSSIVGMDGRVVVVDETNSRLVFKEIVVPDPSARITFDSIPPLNPRQGDGWWNTTDGTLFLFYQDADSGQWVESGNNNPASRPLETLVYDYGAFYDGQPETLETVYRWRAPRAHKLSHNFLGCLFTCGTNPTSNFSCDVLINGTKVGSWAINPQGASTLVSSGAGDIIVPANQEIKIVAPAIPDATLADLVISFKGERF